MKELNLGDKVKDFKLKDQEGKEVSLSDFKGKKVLVSFHPFAWTSVCTDQMRALERNAETLKDNNVVALGLSVDPQPSKAAWANILGLEELRILSDFSPVGEVAKDFGVFVEKMNSSGRANFLIDEEGKLIWKKIYEISELPDIHEILKEIKK